MSFSGAFPLLHIRRQILLTFQFSFPRNNYAKKESNVQQMVPSKKKKMGKLGPVIEKKKLPVEENIEKLVSHCCGLNILKDGEDIKLNPDSEYPEWLWTLRTGPPPTLEELDPESKEYWRRIRKMAMRRNNQIAKLKRF